MNALSLAYSSAQKQTSWTEDPFNIKGFVTGVTKISRHERNLRDYCEELISSYGKRSDDHYDLSLDTLSTQCQLELARLYIESIDREIEWACYGEDQTMNSSFLCALLTMLKNPTPDNQHIFAEVTTRNVLIYYKDTLQDILNTAGYDYFCNEMEQAGYRFDQDYEHGDYVWKR